MSDLKIDFDIFKAAVEMAGYTLVNDPKGGKIFKAEKVKVLPPTGKVVEVDNQNLKGCIYIVAEGKDNVYVAYCTLGWQMPSGVWSYNSKFCVVVPNNKLYKIADAIAKLCGTPIYVGTKKVSAIYVKSNGTIKSAKPYIKRSGQIKAL